MDLEINMILIFIKMITKPRDWGKLFKKEKIQKEMIQILEKGNSQGESEGAVIELNRIKRMNRRQ